MATLLESQVVTVATAMLVQRVVFSAIGLASIYMGYRLFMADKLRGGAQLDGDIEQRAGAAGSGKVKISVGRGGPGLLFALFGMSIALAAVLKPMSVEAQEVGSQQAQMPPASLSADGHNKDTGSVGSSSVASGSAGGVGSVGSGGSGGAGGGGGGGVGGGRPGTLKVVMGPQK